MKQISESKQEDEKAKEKLVASPRWSGSLQLMSAIGDHEDRLKVRPTGCTCAIFGTRLARTRRNEACSTRADLPTTPVSPKPNNSLINLNPSPPRPPPSRPTPRLTCPRRVLPPSRVSPEPIGVERRLKLRLR
ncbi:unnamed protein product [Rhizoctonia solani]|uniref:Uncharacterized protein n=1 Tax=Rhizoctonia solani TaxID=456999 RepID=A0A8H3DT27_9AGAM|nr:unnamed protein product [Rhizoctonia solani]